MLMANGLAAFWCEDKEELDSLVAKTLNLMSSRAWKGYLIYDGAKYYEVSKSVKINSNVACISCLHKPLPKNLPFVHGFIASHELLKSISFENPCSLNAIKGEFSLIFSKDNNLIFSRDHLGTRPLYFASSQTKLGVSSELRVLEELGFKNINEAKNACIYEFKEAMLVREEKWFDINEKINEKINLNGVTAIFSNLLDEAIKQRVSGQKKVAVCFSGGLDSSIIAYIASKYTKVILITVALKGSRDEEWSRLVAKDLNLEHILHIPTFNEIKQSLNEVKLLLRNPSIMDLTIATALRLVAKIAKSNECKVMLVGQAADELFGGYEKFLRVNSIELSRKRILKDIRELYFTTFSRDEPAVAPFVIPLFPYADKSIVELALSLPIEAKLNFQTKERKVILRKVARTIGLKEIVANVPKKALQYSTGLEKTVEDLANIT